MTGERGRDGDGQVDLLLVRVWLGRRLDRRRGADRHGRHGRDRRRRDVVEERCQRAPERPRPRCPVRPNRRTGRPPRPAMTPATSAMRPTSRDPATPPDRRVDGQSARSRSARPGPDRRGPSAGRRPGPNVRGPRAAPSRHRTGLSHACRRATSGPTGLATARGSAMGHRPTPASRTGAVRCTLARSRVTKSLRAHDAGEWNCSLGILARDGRRAVKAAARRRGPVATAPVRATSRRVPGTRRGGAPGIRQPAAEVTRRLRAPRRASSAAAHARPKVDPRSASARSPASRRRRSSPARPPGRP